MTSDDQASKCLLVAPKACNNSPNIASNSPKMAQDSPIMAKDSSRFDPSRLQILARMPQDGYNIAQDYFKDSMSSSFYSKQYTTDMGTWQYNVLIDLLCLFVLIACNLWHANAIETALKPTKGITMSCLYELCWPRKTSLDEHAWSTAYNSITSLGTWQYNVFMNLLCLFVL